MQQVGFNDKDAVFMSLVGGGALMLGTLPAIFYMERFGRRFWACAMLPGFFIGLLIIGCSYLAPVANFNAAAGTYITGLIIYEGFFGSYACLTWVLPAEVYPTYLRSYGMETSDFFLFFCSWYVSDHLPCKHITANHIYRLVTYFFASMQKAMTNIGLTLGFYGGIAVLGWFYQLLFMPETKNKTLEEIDLIFSQPTSKLVAQNLKGVKENIHNLMTGHWGKVFYPSPERPEAFHNEDEGIGPVEGKNEKVGGDQ